MPQSLTIMAIYNSDKNIKGLNLLGDMISDEKERTEIEQQDSKESSLDSSRNMSTISEKDEENYDDESEKFTERIELETNKNIQFDEFTYENKHDVSDKKLFVGQHSPKS